MKHPTVKHIYKNDDDVTIAAVKDGSDIYFCPIDTLDLIDIKKSKGNTVILIDPDKQAEMTIKVGDKVELGYFHFVESMKNLMEVVEGLC